MDIIEDLNYDCNYNLFVTLYFMRINLQSEFDKKRVNDWVVKIMKCNKSLSDLKLRNDFMSYLSLNVQNGELRAPFDQDPPPRCHLRTFARDLPGLDESSMREEEDFAMLKFLPAQHGGFLIPKPMPHVGAYCYIAALNNN